MEGQRPSSLEGAWFPARGKPSAFELNERFSSDHHSIQFALESPQVASPILQDGEDDI